MILPPWTALETPAPGRFRLTDTEAGGSQAVTGDLLVCRGQDARVLEPGSGQTAFYGADTAEEGSVHYIKSVDGSMNRLDIWCCSNPACRGASGVSTQTPLSRCSVCKKPGVPA